MNKYIIEFLGTFFLTYIIFSTNNGLVIGAALAFAIIVGGPVSGGPFNPAVSIALFVSGKIPISDLFPYITAEVAGALAGYELFRFLKVK
jgi:aquaporin Z